MTMIRKPILCVDFDGVIHSYTSPWQGAEVIADPPVPGALRWLWKATEFFDVQVYSSRSKEKPGLWAMRHWFSIYCGEEFGHGHPMCVDPEHPDYPITFAHEKPAAFLTIDDRTICFGGDWSRLDPEALLAFRPWNKRPPASPVALGNNTAEAVTKNGEG